jgi:hypothetical protein
MFFSKSVIVIAIYGILNKVWLTQDIYECRVISFYYFFNRKRVIYQPFENQICLEGSECTNSGTNTKLISKDSGCSSGVDGSTICLDGRIISVGEDSEKIT